MLSRRACIALVSLVACYSGAKTLVNQVSAAREERSAAERDAKHDASDALEGGSPEAVRRVRVEVLGPIPCPEEDPRLVSEQAQRRRDYAVGAAGVVAGVLSPVTSTSGPLVLIPMLTQTRVDLPPAVMVGLSQVVGMPIGSLAALNLKGVLLRSTTLSKPKPSGRHRHAAQSFGDQRFARVADTPVGARSLSSAAPVVRAI